MKIKLLLFSGILLGLSHLGVAENNVRVWTDINGNEVEMQLIKIEGDQVTMRTKDGGLPTFDLTRLIPADQEIAKSMKSIALPKAVGGASAKIDQYIEAKIQREGGKPNEMASDEEFVRRAYLNIAGRIPNYAEVSEFLAEESGDKRSELVDELIDSPAYASHLYNYFGDMLRLRDQLNDNAKYVPGNAYNKWVKESIAANKPYNEFVYEMLTATGKVWENPASGYLLRDSGMQLDNLANTTSIFLGTEIACAQCHDHPFYEDDWTQMKFYKMASFFGSTVTQLSPQDFENGDPFVRINTEVEELLASQGLKVSAGDRDNPDASPQAKEAARALNQLDNIIRANRFVVRDIEENRTKLPHDYKYNDGAPEEEVKPSVIKWPDARNNKVPSGNGLSDREKFASWMTSKENPMFAQVIANRLWQRAFGIALVEPIDNIFDPAMDANPDLLRFLADEMTRVNFDLKEFQRSIFKTAAFGRKASSTQHEPGTDYHFAGPHLTRMSAEQIWDSFMTLAIGSPEKYKGDDGSARGRAIAMDLDKSTGQTAISKLTAYMNRGNENAGSKGGLSKAGMGGMMGEDGAMMEGDDSTIGGNYLTHGGMQLLRASEMRQPAKSDHFLGEFGQSDRSLFDGGSREGAVPQVLRMLNGDATDMVTSYDSLIFRNMGEQESAEDKVDTVFLSILSRRPTDAERVMASAAIDEDGKTAYQDLIWALINTREFMFVQ